ncbi:polysaccharide biosynthesis/export family protein [Actibacterium ureilyticum]|uniref:polysaccharide biosynthesis/export family protein n=1 Tax=Actibacterium ureilyticum TaxID=1590614 RepID=UPI000BAAA5C2|nr:polysaccharide biosynthesis/export family protein [Actibacterium ureilyticum]
MHKARKWFLGTLMAFAMVGGTLPAALAQESGKVADYRLGSLDRVAVKVVAWDSTSLTFTEMVALSGEYTISQDGTLMLPVLGVVDADGLTPAELADAISFDLQRMIGIEEPPSTTVSVAQYRPVYVLGDVQRPGEYAYRPGLRVGQAIAIASGFFRSREDDGTGAGREAIRAGGTLRELRLDLARRKVQEARLLAESESRDDFNAPEGVIHPDGDAAMADLVAREKQLFAARQEALEREHESLLESMRLLETEIGALEGKRGGLNQQVAMMRESVGNMETLLERGLARSPNLIAMQRALIDLEARQLDAETQVFRARQEIAETERRIADLRDRRATNVLDEVQQVQAEIARLEVRIATTQQIVLETGAEAVLQTSEEPLTLVPQYSISREVDGELTRIPADQDTLLMPLDLLQVDWVQPEALAASGSETATQ